MKVIKKESPPVIKRITAGGCSIIGFNDYTSFCEIRENMVFDFLPNIISKEDNMILRTWMEYFTKEKVPFCITEEKNITKEGKTTGGKRKRLWKQIVA